MAPRPLTDGAWLSALDVREHLGVTTADSVQGRDADRARLAAAAYVERVRPDLFPVVDGAASPVGVGPDVVEGATLLAARLYARKGSPTGLASFAEFGASAILRLDPDVERLLGVGRNARPRVG